MLPCGVFILLLWVHNQLVGRLAFAVFSMPNVVNEEWKHDDVIKTN